MSGWRRRALLGAAAASAIGAPVFAQTPTVTVTDGAGRKVAVPKKVERVFPAGPPAAIQLYTLAPDLLLGWPRANRADELEFLLPGIGSRPEVGRLTGRGNSANLEAVLALRPDLIVDSGSTRQTFVELAGKVQGQTGIPCALLDGRFSAIAASYDTLGRLLGRTARARELSQASEDIVRTVLGRIDKVPAVQRPRVYYARGPAGLETGLGGSGRACGGQAAQQPEGHGRQLVVGVGQDRPGAAASSTLPPSGGISPSSVFSSVVLPPPLGPSSASTLARRQLQFEAAAHGVAEVADGQRVRLQPTAGRWPTGRHASAHAAWPTCRRPPHPASTTAWPTWC